MTTGASSERLFLGVSPLIGGAMRAKIFFEIIIIEVVVMSESKWLELDCVKFLLKN